MPKRPKRLNNEARVLEAARGTFIRRGSAFTCIRSAAVLFVVAIAAAGAVSAQSPPQRDTLTLGTLQQLAERTDRRAAQIELLSEQSVLRLATMHNERLPNLAAIGSAQYVSDVASIGSLLPSSIKVPSLHNDQYDSYISVGQNIFDPTRQQRENIERAETAESQARVRAALWQQRALVNDAFFTVLLRDAQMRTLQAVALDLRSRLDAARQRVAAGSALNSEVDMLSAEIGKNMQTVDQTKADRDAARGVLSNLVGRPIPDDVVLVSASTVESDPVQFPDTLRARPEYMQFDRQRDVLSANRNALGAQELPRVSLFGRAGYGRPGVNPLGSGFSAYWIGGVQLQWTPWNWGRTQRDTDALRLQERILATEEGAFTETLRRTATTLRASISALEAALRTDDDIIMLRERVLAEARLRFDEGELNSSDYVSRSTDLLTAQLDRDARRVRLQQARAQYLTTIGREVRP